MAQDEGARFENLVACHLLNWVHFEQDIKARFPEAAAWQISATGTKDYQTPDGVRVAPALRLLEQLI